MKTAILAASISIFAIAAGAFSQAHADPLEPLACNITDISGNALIYAFGPNTVNSNGSFGGTVVEIGFDKNGTATVSPAGMRPIWIYTGFPDGHLYLAARADPGWAIQIDGSDRAILTHRSQFMGSGDCAFQSFGDQHSVGDQGL